MLLTQIPYYKKFYLLTSLFAITGWFWLLLSTSTIGQDVSLCLFKKATGYPCPSCGSTTSLQMILYGDWVGALLKNPLGYVLGLGLVVLPLWLLFDLSLQKRTLYNTMEVFNEKMKKRPLMLILLLSPLIVNWIWMLMR